MRSISNTKLLDCVWYYTVFTYSLKLVNPISNAKFFKFIDKILLSATWV